MSTRKKTVELDYADYSTSSKRENRGIPNVGLHYGVAVGRSEGFLKTMLRFPLTYKH